MLRLTLAALAATIAATPAFAQQEDSQVWGTLAAKTMLDSRTELSFEVIGRGGDAANGLYEVELGGMLGRSIGHGIKIAAGYVRVPGYRNGNVTNIEDRLRQQIGADFGKLARGALTGRIRLEERFRNTGTDMGLRLRPLLRWTLPVAPGAKTKFVLQHESFITLNSTDWGQKSGYERMRNFAGITVPLAPKLDAEIGYLNQYSFGRGGARDKMDHVASLGLTLGF